MRWGRVVKAAANIASIIVQNTPSRAPDLRELKLRLAPRYAGTPTLPGVEDEEALNRLTELLKTPGALKGESTPMHPGTQETLREESSGKLATCLDCVVKHLSTAKVCVREALQRAEAGAPPESIVEKVREIYNELAGMEVDIKDRTVPEIAAIDDEARQLRKKIFSNRWLTNPPTPEQLREIEQQLNSILGKSYKAVEIFLG